MTETNKTNEVKAEEVKTESVELYNANDGVHGRDGGPYLDRVEALNAEKISAAREGKSPNLTQPRGYPGIVLRPKGQQVDNFNPLLTAGDDRRDSSEFTAPVFTTAQLAVAKEGEDLRIEGNPEDAGLSLKDLDKLGK